MRQRRIAVAVKPSVGIASNCDVCGGLMFNAERYMHMNDAYFAPSTILFPYELKNIRYLTGSYTNCSTLIKKIHIILRWIWTSWIGSRFIQSSRYSLPATNVELEYMFDTLGFLWLHHDSPHICYISWRNSLMDYPMIV